MAYFYKGKTTNFKGLGWTGPVGFYGPTQLDADRQEMDGHLKNMESMIAEIEKRGGSAGSLKQVVTEARAKLTQIAGEYDASSRNNFWLGTQGAYFKDAGPKIEQAEKDIKAKLDATPIPPPPAPPSPPAPSPAPVTSSGTATPGTITPSGPTNSPAAPPSAESNDPSLTLQTPADEPNLMMLGIGGFFGLFVLLILLVKRRKKKSRENEKLAALEAELKELRKKTGARRKK